MLRAKPSPEVTSGRKPYSFRIFVNFNRIVVLNVLLSLVCIVLDCSYLAAV